MYTSHTDIDFTGFERRRDLEHIGRFGIYDNVVYRSNVWNHSIRMFYEVLACKEEIFSVYPTIDWKKIQILALVHDDVEVLTGDIQAGNKHNMTQEQLREVDLGEEQAIEEMRKIFPKRIEGYDYGDLLLEIYKKNTIEAQLVKFFDHIDAYCEALHEFFGGADSMLQNIENQYGKVPLPVDYYIERFNAAERYYPKIQDILYNTFEDYTPFECNFPRWDFEKKVSEYHNHTQESLGNLTGYSLYDWRKEVIISSDIEELIMPLIEFSPQRYINNT